MTATQPELFSFANPEAPQRPAPPALTAQSPLSAALAPFEEHERRRELSANTIRCFRSDLRLLVDYLGEETPLGELTADRLVDFLLYLQEERDAPCSPKSLHRRVTALKAFFGWLADEGVLPHDPAAALAREAVDSPLPHALSEAELERLLAVTRSMRDAADAPDARPHLLVQLLLDTAIKKSECLGILLNQIDLSDPSQPSVYIHYERPRQRFKSRRLALSAEFVATLPIYLRRYEPRAHLFECTGRNLEYVLHTLSLLAALAQPLTFETLRWTSALRSFKAGADPEHLRRRLGVAQITWRSTLAVLQTLAAGPL